MNCVNCVAMVLILAFLTYGLNLQFNYKLLL